MIKKSNLGKAFRFEIKAGKADKFKKVKERPVFSVEPESLVEAKDPVSGQRIKFSLLVFLVLTGIILGRTFYLQVVKGGYNFERASQNRLIFEKITAPRGIIYDRKGQVLAENRPIFKLVKDSESKVISKEQALELESQNLAKESPNSGPLGKIQIDLVRSYQDGQNLAHVLGYTSEITADELKKLPNYRLGDRVGRLALESELENYLAGRAGRQLTEVNAKGEIVNILGTQKPTVGENATLTIDFDLQKKLYDELKAGIEKAHAAAGAAIASNPATGEILGFVSYPSFDANALSFGITQTELDKLNSDPAKPFLNRVTEGVYPPGSVFKLATSIAGLETDKIDENTKIEDTGEIFLGQFRFPNWNFICCGKKEGILDLVRAIGRSNDIFFYRVGDLVGVDKLKLYAEKLGLGKKTGIELPEAAGLIPDPAWKKKVKGEIWFPGDTLHMAIGQGDVLTTPIQLNVLTNFFANGGKILKPFLVSKITDGEGREILNFKSKILGQNIASSKDVQLVREGMRQVAAPGGTAWTFADSKIACGAKTGTAEAEVPNPHAWFTVFCPFDSPEISLTVLIESSGEGSSVSGPVARKVIDWYFSNR